MINNYKFRLVLFEKYNNYKIVLFFYHLFFSIVAYNIRITRGISDSHFYWAQNINIQSHSWLDFADYGANFILFINYPLIKLGLPFLAGFFIYGIIGYLGILKWIEFSEKVLGEIYFKGFNVLPILFFLPNLHYWTASLGKEPIVFFAIAVIFNFIVDFKSNLFLVVLASILLLIIRPHVAFLLLFSVLITLLFQRKYTLKNKIKLLVPSISLFLILVYMVFQLALIRTWSWNYLLYSNDYSILSFRKSGSYVPMLDYNFAYKLFSFNFRPLFYDSNTIWSLFASFENCFTLIMFSSALFIAVRYFNKIYFPEWSQVVLLFTLVFSLVYIQRYANLGIFMRTKIMFQPFMMVSIIYIIKQSIAYKKL